MEEYLPITKRFKPCQPATNCADRHESILFCSYIIYSNVSTYEAHSKSSKPHQEGRGTIETAFHYF